MLVCAACGQENPDGFRFCGGCGSPLSDPATEVRKTVTVVFCDLVGSTALGERTDAELLRETMRGYHAELRKILERHGGTVEKFVGDAAMAVFGIPQAHEDDALRALRAAVEMRDAVEALELEVRIGINTGEVVAGSGETLVTGDAVNVAARLEQAAEASEILLGEGTERLVRDAVVAEAVEPLVLKGKSAPVCAYRLVELVPDVPAFTRPIDAPFVGREQELEALERALAGAVEARQPQLATVVGPPGIGKSRLVRELVQRAEAGVVVGRCLSYGEGITYWPLQEIATQLGDIRQLLVDAPDGELAATRIEAALGEASASSDEIAWGFRKLFEALARQRPLIVVLDDIHWAEPTLLDLIEYVATFAQDAPLLLLCTARADLFEERPDWTTPKPNASVVTPEPLADEQAEALVDELGGVDPEAKDRIIEAAEGNPLFVEQLLAHQHDSADGALEIPPTLQALLAARIDRLDPGPRAVIARASVEGRLFHRGAVHELLPEQLRPQVGSQLMTLVRKELIRPDRSALPGDDGFRFGHVLIRDAAYESLPKRLRAELHERFAEWLEERMGGRAPDEILGYHLEQAYRLRVEVGAFDPELGRRAAERLRRGGELALRRGDMPAARDLLDRALELADRQPELVRLAGIAHSGVGDLAGAAALFTEAIETGDELTHWRASVELARVRPQIDATAWESPSALFTRAEEARSALEALGDDEGLAKAYLLLGDVHNGSMQFAAFEEAATRAVEHARRAGAVRDEEEARAWLAMTLFYGPRPVADAIARAEALLADAPGPYGEGGALVALGALRFMGGERTLGRELTTRAHGIFNDLGMRLWSAGSVHLSAAGAAAGGDLETAERLYRWGIGELEQMGEVSWSSAARLSLARVLCERGEFQEAEALREAVPQSTADDLWNTIIGNAVRARVCAAQGRVREALDLARAAVEASNRIDVPVVRGDAHCDLAHVAFTAGREEEGIAALREAVEIYERKGMVVAASSARALLNAQ